MKLYRVAFAFFASAFFVPAWLASAAPASANANLPQMLLDASICSDASLQVAASSTCDSPSDIAAMAIAKCQNEWNAIAVKALGSPPANGSLDEHRKAVLRYRESLEIEYTRVAELKTLGIRTAAGKCGFE